ncbi:hypothetical protein FHL15_006265 [Xylaria flabelliformis]|uniref:Uncharacterized protein n=1 Tax=Xylaria flabelliformis TaxID=2512241 RepID=A0A553HY50_9PEZI|nr:hypothetical protein FHL15_006265 [Xylaria flabelliformis]
MALNEFVINTRKMSIESNLRTHEHDISTDPNDENPAYHLSSQRVWLKSETIPRPPQSTTGRHIGTYALTTEIAPWVKKVMTNYQPTTEVLELVRPFASELHAFIERERELSSGLHDLNVIEMAYQHTLEIGAAILLGADATNDPVDLALQFHASKAGGDDHLAPWGRLLTGLECDPPIIVQFPFYLLMCQSFTFEPTAHREDYVYTALTGVDWAKGQNKFSERLTAFEALARSSVPTLDTKSEIDRCFWRIALAYLESMNRCENARPLKTPKKAYIRHGLDPDLVIAARALDTIGSAYMCRDGAAWLDDEGMDSLIGSALPNDIMDLHTDVLTGETRNLLRLLYPPCNSIDQAKGIVSGVLSSMLGEIFRSHYRARMLNREDGRVSSTSPAYSFCRARHRRIFETLEQYINRYPLFWKWTWEIYNSAKSQITDASVAEPLIRGLKRAVTGAQLPPSPANRFFYLWYDMVEDGSEQLAKSQPLGVSEDLAPVIRDLHHLWHGKFLDDTKKPGWGREFDHISDTLLGNAGEILARRTGKSDDMYKFTIAYGILSMGLPYIAYHTIDAIIMTYGVDDSPVMN